MTYDMLTKLVMDCYDADAGFRAKSVLLEYVVLPEDDDKKRSRMGLNKKLNTMKDILNVFLIVKSHCLLQVILLIYRLSP